jgi:hypothetical protein
MTARRAAAVLALAAVAALAAGVEPAAACSCALGDPRTALAQADAAFVGALVEKRVPSNVRSSAYRAVYVFRVAEAVKGDLRGTVEVQSAISGASCGIETEVGKEIGLLLDREGDAWTSSLCRQLPADQLREAARPLPEPDGSGAPALVVGGKFGGARTVVLDRAARTLAYGTGVGTVYALSPCPGGRTVAELVDGPGGFRVAVRDLPGARLRWTSFLPYSPRRFTLALMACGPRGVDVFLSTIGVEWKPPHSRLVRVAPGRIRVLHRGNGWTCGFGRGRAFVTAGARLLSVPLAGGAARLIARVPRGAGPFTPSPDGRRLAGLLDDHKRGGGIVLVDLASRPRARLLRVPGTNGGGELAWLDSGRFVFLPRSPEDVDAGVYDTSLRVRASFSGWEATDAAVVGGRAYGVRRGELISARLPNGPVEVVRRLPGMETYALAAIDPVLPVPDVEAGPSARDDALPRARWLVLLGAAAALLVLAAVLGARRGLRPSRSRTAG